MFIIIFARPGPYSANLKLFNDGNMWVVVVKISGVTSISPWNTCSLGKQDYNIRYVSEKNAKPEAERHFILKFAI